VIMGMNETSDGSPVDLVVMRINTMRGLQDDWDSYGAVAPQEQSIERAIVFIRGILGNPHVCPSVNGNVVFEWNGGSIEIGATPNDDFIWIDGDE